ncbi:hypothetical protein [Ammonifex thiophilus]|uniref:hypothetical protein n=1 Tax=Ammonifex thiophilus TaxID=444093 RepID=UPI0010696FAB|nr:hypothetical protein [Ammonifex thiophilus]
MVSSVEVTIQVLTGFFFVGVGLFLFVFRHTKMIVALSPLVIGQGLFLALLTVMLPQPESWRVGLVLLLTQNAVVSLCVGIDFLVYRQREALDSAARKYFKTIGFLFLIFSFPPVWLLALYLGRIASR